MLSKHQNQITVLTVIAVAAALLLRTDNAFAKCAYVETNLINCADKSNGVFELLLIGINILSGGVTILAIGGVVYGAVLYASAGGDSSQITKAKEMLRNTIIGIAAFALMYSGLQYIIPGGVFDRSYSLPDATKPVALKPATSKAKSSTSSTESAKITSIKNFRDAGASSGALKDGVLFRSQQLSELSSADALALSKKLGSGGIVIDLRQASDYNKVRDKVIPGVENIKEPVKATVNYASFVTNADNRASFGDALRAAASAEGGVLVHCTSGKDRTGWFVAIIMKINGASYDDIKNEYLASRGTGPVNESWLKTGFSEATKKYGSFNNYLKKGLGLSTGDIAKLKSKF